MRRLQRDPEPSATLRLLRRVGFGRDRSALRARRRASESAACGIGLFWAFIPLPSQMLPAAATAVTLRANLPLTLAWVWVANPFTMPPMFYFNYRLGAWLLGQPQRDWTFEWSWIWLRTVFTAIGPPLYLGSAVAGGVVALAGYSLVRALGRWRTVRRWHSRATSRRGEAS